MPERAAPAGPSLPSHPLLAQHWLELRASLRRLRVAPAQGGFLLLAWAGLGLLIVLAARGPLREPLHQAAALALAWPWLAAGLLLAWMRLALGGSARGFEHEHAQGWLAALPCPQALHRRGRWQWLLLRACLLALASAGALAIVLFDAPLPLASRVNLILLPLPAALFALLWAGWRRPARVETATADAQVLASSPRKRFLLMPPRGPLPELADWQQREAQRRWRQGRSGLWLLVLWLMIPAGEAGPVLLVLALLGLALAALRAVVASSIVVLDRAEALLAATPRRRFDFCASALPYPTSRLLSMAALAGLLVAPLAGIWTALGAALAILSLGLLELAIALRFPNAPARRRVRLSAELVLLALLARQGAAPLLPLLLPVLIAWHLRQASR